MSKARAEVILAMRGLGVTATVWKTRRSKRIVAERYPDINDRSFTSIIERMRTAPYELRIAT